MSKGKQNSAELFVKCLENEGVNYIFGVPGEENLDFLEAIRTSSIKFVTVRDEQSAVFMAATLGRLTGRVGVALSTLGPGATNLMTGVAYANLGGMPLLVITGQKPIRKSKQGNFQIINVVRMMEPLTKYSATIESVERIPSMVRQAVKLAESERPGAVHLEFPEDIAEESIQKNLKPISFRSVRRPAPDPTEIEKAISLIETSKHPLIVIASGANRRLIRKQLLYFLEKTKIPFVTTQMGKGVENENSDLYIGTTALSSGDYVHQALNKADTIIMLGHDISEKPPIVLTPDKHKVIHINFSPADIDDVYIPTNEIVGDVSHTLWVLAEKIKIQKSWDFKYFFKVRDALKKNILKATSIKSFPIMPAKIVADVYTAMPTDGILALDNGMYKIWFARNYKAREQNSVLLDNALATMGAGLPSGIATKILFPKKKVLVIAGDGGIMMNIAELETACRLRLDLVVLILNDSGYGMIRWKQEDMKMPAFGLGFNNPDFVKLAQSFGAKGYKIKKTEDFLKILKKALNSKGVHVIDCPIDYSQNLKDLGVGLKSEINKI
jgi:acetolactate synthase-1/2/3 large subunit